MLLFFSAAFGQEKGVPSEPSGLDDSTLFLCHFDGSFVPDYARNSTDLKVEADNVKFTDGRFGKGIGGFDLIKPERSAALFSAPMTGEELLANPMLRSDKLGVIDNWNPAVRRDGKIVFEGETPMQLDVGKEFLVFQNVGDPLKLRGRELILSVTFKAREDSNVFVGMECLPRRPDLTSGFIYDKGVYAGKPARKGCRDKLSLYVLIPEGTTSIRFFMGGGHFYVPELNLISFEQASLRELANFSMKEGSLSLWVKFPFTKPGNCSLFNFSNFWAGPSMTYIRGYGGSFSFNLGTRYDGGIATASVQNLGDSLFDGKWHYFLTSWKNINTGRRDGELYLSIDGNHCGRLSGEYIRCNQDVERLFLGAWHVGNRDIYPAEALIDEIKITNKYRRLAGSAE